MMGGSMGGTSGSPRTGQVFLPPGQPEAAAMLGNIANPLFAMSMDAGARTPAGQNYPWAQNFVDRFLTGNSANGPTPFNDLMGRAFNPAYAASDYASQSFVPRGIAQSDILSQLGSGAAPLVPQALAQGFDPAYGAAVSSIQNNPYFGQALAGAQQGANLGTAGANAMGGAANQISGAVSPLLQSGFDPQAALFNRSRDQLMDQTHAVNAMSGLAGTPYGASVESNALGNFDINWQNQQLARQAQAAQAAGTAADRAGLLQNMAPGLAATSGALPGAAYAGQQSQILQALAARNQGAAQGLSNFGAGAQAVGGAFQGGQGLGSQAAQTGMQFGAAPYNLGTGIASNALSGLTNATNLGNNQFQLPNQQIGNLMQYMGLGQNAAQIGGQLQNQGFNQLAQGIGGGLSAANSLFGGNGLLSGGGALGGMGGLGGLLPGFGGAGGAGLGGAAELAAFEGPWAGAGAAEGGSLLGGLAPLALSA